MLLQALELGGAHAVTAAGAERLVDREIADLDLGRGPRAGRGRRRASAQAPARVRAMAPGPVLGQDAQLILARQLVVLGDEAPAMGDLQPAAAPRATSTVWPMSVNGTE